MLAPLAFFLKALRRFSRAREGVSAVEFSLVATPFFFLTFGLAEVGMLGLAQTSLNFAVYDAGRQIRTGQAQLGGLTHAEIETMVCDGLNKFIRMSCAETLYLDVQRFDSFVDAAPISDPVTDGVFNDAGFSYLPGGPDDIVVVRAFYRWQVLTPLFEGLLGNINGGDRLLSSTMMFRNEPY
jgi:Flp pilus assembly protein TadG